MAPVPFEESVTTDIKEDALKVEYVAKDFVPTALQTTDWQAVGKAIGKVTVVEPPLAELPLPYCKIKPLGKYV